MKNIDADGAWKEVCARKLELVLALLYPEVHATLRWDEDYDPLDPELRKLTQVSVQGNRVADCVIKAFDKQSGDARYFNMEVQGKQEDEFPRRVYVCNSRCVERYGVHVTALVVLIDTDKQWRPDRFVSGNFPIQQADAPTPGVSSPGEQPAPQKKPVEYHDQLTLLFLTAKIIDFEGREAQLETNENTMGLFVVAQVTAMRSPRNTKKHKAKRAEVKLRLLLNLRERRMDADDVRFWVDCIERLLPLPHESNREIWDHLQLLDKEQSMTFVSFPEQRGIDKGLQQGQRIGLVKAIRLGLKLKFQSEGLALMPQIEELTDGAALAAIYAALDGDASLDDIRKLIPAPPDVQTDPIEGSRAKDPSKGSKSRRAK